MTDTQLAKPRKGDLKALLSSDAMRDQFASALPKHLPVERFCRVAITSLSRIPKLRDCTPESFFKCLLDLSAMGLEPDGRRAHLIPYGKECTLILDYKGLVELARRSGDVAKIHADVVCENDVFRHDMGEVSTHTFDLKKDRGKPYAAYAQVTLKDGSVQAAIMSKSEVEAIRKRSRAAQNGPWVTDWNEMAKKTAFRRLTKWLTLSPEVHQAITAAEETEFQGMRNVTPEIPVPTQNPFLPPAPDGAQGDPATGKATGEAACPEVRPHETEVPAVEHTEEQDEIPMGTTRDCYVENITVKRSGEDVKKKWVMYVLEYSVDGTIGKAATFSETVGQGLADIHEGDKVRLTTKPGKKGDLIESVELIEKGQ